MNERRPTVDEYQQRSRRHGMLHPRAWFAAASAAIILLTLQFDGRSNCEECGWPFAWTEVTHFKGGIELAHNWTAAIVNAVIGMSVIIGVALAVNGWAADVRHRDRISVGILFELTTIAAVFALWQSATPGVHTVSLNALATAFDLHPNTDIAEHHLLGRAEYLLPLILGCALCAALRWGGNGLSRFAAAFLAAGRLHGERTVLAATDATR